MADSTLTPDQESRAARIRALTDAQRENVLFLLSVSDPARVDWALRSVEPPSPDQVAVVLGAFLDSREAANVVVPGCTDENCGGECRHG